MIHKKTLMNFLTKHQALSSQEFSKVLCSLSEREKLALQTEFDAQAREIIKTRNR